MLQLLKLHGSIISNYTKFQTNKDKIDLLKKNITLFNAVDEQELGRTLKTASTYDLERCNEALLIMAKSYTEYAFATLDNKAQNYLESAEQCYHHIARGIGELPARSLTHELGTQNSAAEFYKLQNQFDKARLNLTFLLNAAQIEAKVVLKIIQVCRWFENQLRQSYKDSAFQARISIDTSALLSSVSAELKKAQQLLENDKVQKTKRTFIEANEPSQDSHKPQKKEQRRLKKMKQTPSHEQEDTPPNDSLSATMVPTTVPDNREGLAELATAAASLHSFFFAPMAPDVNQVNLNLAEPHEIEKYVADSKKCNHWVTEWEEENGRSHTLEMLGYALLEAAISLQQRSAIYHNQKTNPAIQFAVKFLLMSIAHTDNPTEEQRELSITYHKLLKPFTMFQIMGLKSQYYLEHLRTHFITNQDIPSFHNLNSQEMVDALFKTLDSMCSATDYEIITSVCFKSLKTTTNGYTKETCHTI